MQRSDLHFCKDLLRTHRLNRWRNNNPLVLAIHLPAIRGPLRRLGDALNSIGSLETIIQSITTFRLPRNGTTIALPIDVRTSSTAPLCPATTHSSLRRGVVHLTLAHYMIGISQTVERSNQTNDHREHSVYG